MDFDANSVYPSAMWDENSVFPEIKIYLTFKPHMNDGYVEAFYDQTFVHGGNESAKSKKNEIPST